LIKNEKNIGVAPSWNLGIDNAKYKYICFVNNDIEFMSHNWISELQKILKKQPGIYWTSPRTCYIKNIKKVPFKRVHYEQLMYGTNRNSYVVGCCFMCPKKIFGEIGNFDEKFEVKFYEDLDFINRIFQFNKYVSMCQSALIYHERGATSKIIRGGELNESYYKKKWGNTQYDILSKQDDRKKYAKFFEHKY